MVAQQVKLVRKWEKCNGRMFLDVWAQSCKRCKENGATVCENCWLHYEWQCAFGCGRLIQLPRVRRKDDPFREAREVASNGR